jgi:hypothetical protein
VDKRFELLEPIFLKTFVWSPSLIKILKREFGTFVETRPHIDYEMLFGICVVHRKIGDNMTVSTIQRSNIISLD